MQAVLAGIASVGPGEAAACRFGAVGPVAAFPSASGAGLDCVAPAHARGA